MQHLLPAPLKQLWAHLRSEQAAATIRSDLLAQLGLSAALAEQIVAGHVLPRGFRYRHFTVPKRDGSLRELVEPGPRLKATQRAVVDLLKDVAPHPAALGFRRGLSIADHAWAHAGAAVIITADIQDFFGSTQRGRIEKWWEQRGYDSVETRLFTRLTTYRGGLPQGAPSSPILSNLVNVDLDTAITQVAQHAGGIYTRYADDLAFSWPSGFGPPLRFEETIRARLREAGYALHPAKGWHVWRRQDEPELTGLVLTRGGDVELPQALKTIMRTLAGSQHPHDQQRLSGYESYRAMIKRGYN